MALAPWLKTTSAALSRVPADTFESSMIFNTVVTAAPDASCNRAMESRKAGRRASRYAASKLGIFGPTLERVRADPDRAGGRLQVLVGQQRGNRLFLLVAEFCPMS